MGGYNNGNDKNHLHDTIKEEPLARPMGPYNNTYKSNFFSNIFLSWVLPFFLKGRLERLETIDVPQTRPQDTTKIVMERLAQNWKRNLETGKRPRLYMALLKTFGLQHLLTGLLFLLSDGLKIGCALLMGVLISYVRKGSSVPTAHAYIAAVSLAVAGFVLLVAKGHYLLWNFVIAMQIRSALSGMIYQKSLVLSNGSRSKAPFGHIFTLLSSDVETFHEAVRYMNIVWVAPIVAVVCCFLMYRDFGVAIIPAYAVICLIIIFQLLTGKISEKISASVSAATDSRIVLMNEILSGIRLIKIQCWEKLYGDQIEEMRSEELTWRYRDGFVKGARAALTAMAGKIVLLTAATTLVYIGGDVTMIRVFRTLALILVLESTLFRFLPACITCGSEMIKALGRIETFLKLEEKSDEVLRLMPPITGRDGRLTLNLPPVTTGSILMAGVSAKWPIAQIATNLVEKESGDKHHEPVYLGKPALEDIGLSISKGQLIGVVGKEESGKSSLLAAMVRQLIPHQGKVSTAGRISYCPQQPWTFSDTIRNNITFGNCFNRAKYIDVIESCALDKDIAILPMGDLTEVCEKDDMISEAMRLKISLARAVYNEADIYILDDPFRSLSAGTAHHIFNRCICEYLRGKTRVIVTHQVHILRSEDVDNIVVMEEGSVVVSGVFSEIEEHLGVLESAGQMVTEVRSEDNHSRQRRADTKKATRDIPYEGPSDDLVNIEVYKDYYKAGNGFLWMSLLLFLGVITTLGYVSGLWLYVYWGGQDREGKMYEALFEVLQKNSTTAPPSLYYTPVWYVNVIGGVLLATLVLLIIREISVFSFFIKCSKVLHKKMFKAVMNAPLRFFEVNPIDKILNLFARDTHLMDEQLPFVHWEMSFTGFLIGGALIVSCVTIPWLCLPAIIIAVITEVFNYFTERTVGDVRRIESALRDPQYKHFTDTLTGLPTIQAYKAMPSFVNKFTELQDRHTSAWFFHLCATRWMAFILNVFISLYLFSVAITVVALRKHLDEGNVALVIYLTLEILYVFDHFIRRLSDLEYLMASPERVVRCSKIPQEYANERLDAETITPGWPLSGEIDIEGMSLFPSDGVGPVLLKDVNLTIPAANKIGIVGSANSGKNAMVSAVCRLIEPTGRVLIDGINISKIHLPNLRAVISVIPRDPVLMSGSLRYNLDPYDQYEETEIWRVLAEVTLRRKVLQMDYGIYTDLSSHGDDFTLGERQLLCLARAILVNNQIIIDETLSSADPQTGRLIHSIIKRVFADQTVLTLANNPKFIMDSDLFMVMDKGRVVQYGRPKDLLHDEEGYLRGKQPSAEPQDLITLSSSGGSSFVFDPEEEASPGFNFLDDVTSGVDDEPPEEEEASVYISDDELYDRLTAVLKNMPKRKKDSRSSSINKSDSP